MSRGVPNLFRMEEHAVRLYELYLGRLEMNGLDEEVVAACRQIRRHAARSVGVKEALFTLPYVYKSGGRPRELHHVALRHFYDRLGRSLGEWDHWEAFVGSFHPRLFCLAGVSRDELLHDPQRLGEFDEKLTEAGRARITSSVTRGQADLVESEEQVRRAQQSIQEKLDEFQERIRPTKERTDAKLKKLFPELRGLPWG
jgi:hypothetical protein